MTGDHTHGRNSFVSRILRAIKLDPQLYEEVEADRQAMGQAIFVLILSGFAAGIGSMALNGTGTMIVGTIAAIGGWLIWAALIYVIGVKLFPEPQTESDLGELLRTTGFASAPGLLRVFGVIPGTTGLIFMVVSIWMLIAMVVAVRQALDYRSTPRAILVCMLGWLVQVVAFWFLVRPTGIESPP